MNTSEPLRLMPSTVPLAMAIAVFGIAVALSFTSLLNVYPELAFATAFDLILSAPIFYYLAIRKTRIPKITVTVVFSLGFLIAYFLLPSDTRIHVRAMVTTVLPAIELTVTALIGYKAYKSLKAYKKNRTKSNDLRIVLREVCDELLGKSVLSKALAFEISILAYAFLPVRKLKSAGHVFSYFKLRGTNLVYGVIAFVIATETLVLHVLLATWSVVAAWVFTISSFYIGIILLAQFRAIRKRPIEILADSVVVRCGLFCEALIRFEDIESVEPVTMLVYSDPDIYHAALLKGIEDLNILITLKRETVATGPYWTKRKFKRISLFVDQKDEFLELMSKI